MLTKDEKDYISKIPLDKKVVIKPYTNSMNKIASQVIIDVQAVCPNLDIVHMGASGLGISGQGDIDIYALANPNDFKRYLTPINKVLGKPSNQKFDSIAWTFIRNSNEVEFYLTDPKSDAMIRQLAVFEILQNNSDLLTEYKKLKEGLNGKSFREYQTRKYEFYHRILGSRFE